MMCCICQLYLCFFFFFFFLIDLTVYVSFDLTLEPLTSHPACCASSCEWCHRFYARHIFLTTRSIIMNVSLMNVCAKVEYLEPLFKGSMRLKENIFKSRRVKIYAEIKTRTGLLCLEEEKSESLCNQIQIISPRTKSRLFSDS